jgi:uncharacterized repeat protein (TIGR01451 family)
MFLLASLVLACLGALTVAPSAAAATCGGSTVTVTPMHSPDGTQRPFYADFSRSSTKHSGYVGYELSGANGVLGSDVWIKLSGFSGGALALATNQSASIPARATSANGKPLVYAYLTASSATTTAQTFTVEVWNGKPGLTGSSQVCTTTDGFSKVVDVQNAAANKINTISASNTAPAIGGTFDVTATGTTGTMGAGDASDQVSGNGVFSMAPAMDDSWNADAFSLTGVSLTMGSSASRDKLRFYPTTSSSQSYTVVYSFTVRGTTTGATTVYPVQNIASGTQVKYTGTYPSTIPQISSPTVSTTLTKTAVSVAGPPYVVSYRVDATNSSNGAVTLDYLKDTPTPTSGWSFVSGSAKLGTTSLPDPANDGTSLTFPGPFTVPATGSITLTYKLALSATVTNSVTGQVGGTTIGSGGGSGNQVAVDPTSPVVSTASLADATIGQAYSATLAAAGGSGTYSSWAVSAGSLPAGLSLNSSTGVVSGTPTATGAASFTVTVTDSASRTGSKALTLTVVSAPDTTAPAAGALTINGGAAATTSTSVTLGLAATDATGVTAYRVAEGSDCSAASWVFVSSATSFSASASFALSSGDGTKTVCVQYEDAAGNVSSTATASITLDTPPGVTLSTPAAATTNAPFTVTATFTKSVTGLTLAGVSVGGGGASNLQGSGTTYTFLVTPAADGAVTVDLAAGSATDAAGYGNTAAAQLTRAYDATRPSVTLSTTAPATTNAPFTVTATFSEAVTGLSLLAVSVGNGTPSLLQGSGTTYTFLVTPTADGTVTVDLAAGTASDVAGNTNTAAAQLSRTYAGTGPSVVLTSTAPSATHSPFTVTATFSASVTGLALGSIAVGNGSASNLQGSGTTYTFDVTPAADGTVTVDLAANAAQDGVGNGNTAAARLTRTYDATAPSVALSTAAAATTNAPFTVTATFSEAVTGFVLADVSVGNGTASSLQGSGTTYTFVVTPAASGTVTVDVAANVAADAAGNGNSAAVQLTRAYDGTRPSVVLTSGSPDPTNAAATTVTAAFSKSVSGFSLAGVSVGNGTASNLQGSGATYTFTVAPAADGTVTVDVAAGGATDGAGNTNTAAAQLTWVYDGTRPSAALSSTSSDPVNGAFTVKATFSEAVAGFALADVTVSNGSASSLQGSGTTYTFVVTPSGGDVAVDLPANGASDAAGNGNLAATRLARRYDATRPSVVLSTDAKSPTNASSFVVTATFSKPVTGLTLAAIAVGNGSASGLAGSGDTYTFRVTPAGDGDVTIDLSAGAAVDGVGNQSTAAARLTVVSDRTPPVVKIDPASLAVDDTHATVTCTLDGAAVPCSTSLDDLSPGTHTFVVRAVDAAGNLGTATRSWTVDAPVNVEITNAPPVKTSSTSGTITFAADGASQCSLDGAPFGPCSSPFRFADLAVGDHTFEVRTTDAAGKVTTARSIWTVVATRTAAPDIHVSMTASTQTVTAGEVFDTHVTATNDGDASATEFTLTIALPPDTEFVSGTARLVKPLNLFASADDAFPCSVDAQVVRCPVGVLDPSAKYVVDLQLRALRKGSFAVGAQGSSAETQPATASVWLNARPPKLQITVDLRTSRSYDQVLKGEVFDAIGTVTNVGGAIADDVAVEFLLPSIGKFVSGTTVRVPGGTSGGFECTLAGRTLSCPIGELRPKASFVVKLRLRALASGTIRVATVASSSTQSGVRSQLVLHAPNGKRCTIAGVPRCPSRSVAVVYAGDALFAFDSCRVTAAGERRLRSLRPLIARARTVTVSGYTDAIGSLFYNRLLSLCRARAAAKALVGGLKDAPRVRIVGLGEQDPVASNATAAGRARNRRVEVHVTVAR